MRVHGQIRGHSGVIWAGYHLFRRLAFLITHFHLSARDISQPVSGWWLSAW
ncbi:hypothetical protein CSO61_002525 [Salmonella enterica subsp. diarizonae]|nr:hypothetical protein [Salmonella enterica subsp. diarizonae]